MSEGNDVKKNDITVEILKDIRQEIRALREDTNARFAETHVRIDQTNARLDEMGARLDVTNTRVDGLGRRVVEAEVRMATAMTDLAHDVHELTSYLRAQGDLRPRVERCEKDIAELQTKLRPAS